MVGALSTTLLVALFAVTALHPHRPARSTPFNLQFAISWWINEAPVIALWWLALGTGVTLVGPRDSPWWWVVVGLVVADVVLLVWLLLRARAARPALGAALIEEYGARGRPGRTPTPWWRILVLPVMSWRPDVRRIRDRRYGPAGRAHLLDVYVSRRSPTTGGPVLVYLHGGGFVMGSKRLGGRPLLERLASRGWVCVSANYRLRGASYAERLDDTRAALDWVRGHAEDLGGEPAAVFLAGGSAGAHLAATTALVGKEVRGVAIVGVVGMYGFYGQVDNSLPGGTVVADHARPDAPPFLILHGALDTLVRREDVRETAQRLAAVSRSPVVHVEMPWANHNFDFFPSLRLGAVCDAVIRFAELTLDRPGRGVGPTGPEAGSG
ncbi:alpha/beta hydrolase [Ornithinimicrobium avium]|uniref:Alpha/beta hydrolase n=1 Tax=Ornithinimicrobium avium TaxID=2283195 RepID=A0A345NJV1_9MICO|nr:alpha/beta hydrolase [Ornithinimicrobium avium]AXH95309.1 alpha/beta hydrolase [Ornithinimicrobium avium]